ncbi:MAG: hypothetical protein AAGJ35_07585, partial [Myxococcota bacterium]
MNDTLQKIQSLVEESRILEASMLSENLDQPEQLLDLLETKFDAETIDAALSLASALLLERDLIELLLLPLEQFPSNAQVFKNHRACYGYESWEQLLLDLEEICVPFDGESLMPEQLRLGLRKLCLSNLHELESWPQGPSFEHAMDMLQSYAQIHWPHVGLKLHQQGELEGPIQFIAIHVEHDISNVYQNEFPHRLCTP